MTEDHAARGAQAHGTAKMQGTVRPDLFETHRARYPRYVRVHAQLGIRQSQAVLQQRVQG